MTDHQPQPLPLKVSQKARDAAFYLMRDLGVRSRAEMNVHALQAGKHDDNRYVQAFAAFERDLSAPSGEGGVEPDEAARKAYDDASNAYATHLGDPDGRDDHNAAKDAAALVIERYAATQLAEVERERDDLLDKVRVHAGGHIKAINRDMSCEARLAQAVAALEFYANGIGFTEIEDGGKLAADTIAQIKGTPDAQ